MHEYYIMIGRGERKQVLRKAYETLSHAIASAETLSSHYKPCVVTVAWEREGDKIAEHKDNPTY